MARDASGTTMYAVIQHGSHQYRVDVGDTLLVDHVDADVGASVRLENVVLLTDGDATKSASELAGAVVIASVVAQRRGRKLRVMTYKPKKRHRRTMGYRSLLTELRIEEIRADGVRAAAPRRAATERPPTRGRGARAAAATQAEAPAEAPAAVSAAEPVAEPATAEPPEAASAEEKPKTRARRTTASRKSSKDQGTGDGA